MFEFNMAMDLGVFFSSHSEFKECLNDRVFKNCT